MSISSTTHYCIMSSTNMKTRSLTDRLFWMSLDRCVFFLLRVLLPASCSVSLYSYVHFLFAALHHHHSLIEKVVFSIVSTFVVFRLCLWCSFPSLSCHAYVFSFMLMENMPFLMCVRGHRAKQILVSTMPSLSRPLPFCCVCFLCLLLHCGAMVCLQLTQ